MLLRCSRIAELLEKQAFVSQALKIVGKTGRTLSKNQWKQGKRLAGGALVGVGVGVPAVDAAARTRQGLSEEAFQLRQQGRIPSGPIQFSKG